MASLDAGEMQFHGNVKSQDLPRQMAWFEAALAASTAPWKIVVGHHPVYSGGQHGDTPYLVKHVLPLLEKHGVQVYFNGHDHDLQHLQAGKVNLFCTGGGSRPRKNIKTTAHTKFGLGCSGFIAASLSSDSLDVRMIDDIGKLLYSTLRAAHGLIDSPDGRARSHYRFAARYGSGHEKVALKEPSPKKDACRECAINQCRTLFPAGPE